MRKPGIFFHYRANPSIGEHRVGKPATEVGVSSCLVTLIATESVSTALLWLLSPPEVGINRHVPYMHKAHFPSSHQTPCKACTKQDMCMKPNVIPLTPQGHFVPQLYHRTVRGMSSLKTSSYFRTRSVVNKVHPVSYLLPLLLS